MLSSYISSMRERYNASFGSCHLPSSFPQTLHFPKNCGLKKQNWNHKSQTSLPVMLLTHTALSVQRGLKLLSCECKQKFCSYIWEDSAEIIEHIRNRGHFLLISTMKAGCFFCELFKCLLFHRQISHYIYMINWVTHQILGFKFKMPWRCFPLSSVKLHRERVIPDKCYPWDLALKIHIKSKQSKSQVRVDVILLSGTKVAQSYKHWNSETLPQLAQKVICTHFSTPAAQGPEQIECFTSPVDSLCLPLIAK